MNDLFFKDLQLISKDKKQFESYRSMSNTAVIAGPGSGKTRVLILKAITLAKSYVHKPSGLACISYSRECVREIKKRFKSYNYTISNKDFIGTVHSFSLLHVIHPFAHLYPQYKIKYPIKIIPYEISNQIYQGILSELKIKEDKDLPLIDINKHRSLSLSGRSTIKVESTELIRKAAKLYETKLHNTEYTDFIDIINIAARIIKEQDFVKISIQSKFPWLLVDEYQDLGKALHEMVLELVFAAGIKLYVVGDVNQSIYGFNGGYPEFLREITDYDDINTIYLTANYRSSQHIINASLEALQPIPPFPKYNAETRKDELADFTFITCDEEMKEQYEVVSKNVIPHLLNKGVSLNEIAIIISSNTLIKEMAIFLEKEKIPFFIVNWKFENSEVIVWLQECAMWCVSRENQSFDELFRFWVKLLNTHNDSRQIWENIRLKVTFYNILFESLSKNDVFGWIDFIINKLELKKTLTNSEIYPNEVKNIELLIEEAKLYNLRNANIKRFANLGSPDNEVTITTRHSCKGLEFEAVILLGMEEDHFPSYYHLENPIALAEDQRICYVCISRAKKTCVLIRSKVFTIPTKRGLWRKDFAPSRYWVNLYKKFGSENNSFNKAYN